MRPGDWKPGRLFVKATMNYQSARTIGGLAGISLLVEPNHRSWLLTTSLAAHRVFADRVSVGWLVLANRDYFVWK